MCGNDFDKNQKMLITVKDCCHYTGYFRRATDLVYNLGCRWNSYILIIALILSGYDNYLNTVKIAEKIVECSLNGWVLVYELSGYGFKSCCCH